MRLHKRVETLLRSLRIEGASARKANAFTQRDAPGQRILLRDRFRQPGLQLHLVCETEQRLANAVANAGPAAVVAVRIDVRLTIFSVEGGVAKNEGLALRLLRRLLFSCTAAKAERQRKQRQQQK